MFDSKFQAVLDGYEDRAAQEAKLWEAGDPKQLFARRDEFLLHVGREVGDYLLALVVASGSKKLVELGTSYGYSTLFLAEAARRTGGKLFTIELSADKQRHASEQIHAAGLSDHVEFLCGDALELLKQIDAPFDFVLMDLWKELYVPCLELTYGKLAEHGLIAADNMLEPKMARPEAEAYRVAVRSKPDLQSVLLPIGSGIELSCRWNEIA